MSSITSGEPYQWAQIESDSVTIEKIHLLTHPIPTLTAQGYVFEQLSAKQLWTKTRCVKCNARLRNYKPTSETPPGNAQDPVNFSPGSGTISQHVLPRQPRRKPGVTLGSSGQGAARVRHQCMFHEGKFFQGRWTCCAGRGNTQGCSSNIQHQPCSEADLRHLWKYYSSPAGNDSTTTISSAPTAGLHTTSKIRQAVVLDCEMGIAANGDLELIRVSLIDLFNPFPPLIDSLVKPSVEIRHYNTRYSGVSYSMMNQAVRRRRCLFGRNTARRKIFEYVNANTFVFVHGGKGDFTCLRWLHPLSKIIDTYVLEETHGDDHEAAVDEAGNKVRQGRSLKELAARKCGLAVQMARGSDTGKKMTGHNSLEDALATRELVAWWLAFIPGPNQADEREEQEKIQSQQGYRCVCS